MFHNAAQTYQTNQVTTATPSELTLMLYNGAIKFVKQAKASLEEQNYAKTHDCCIKVQNILYELMNSLKKEYPIALELEKLYEYMLNRTIQANLKKDTDILNEIEDFFVQFRDTWREAMLLAKSQG